MDIPATLQEDGMKLWWTLITAGSLLGATALYLALSSDRPREADSAALRPGNWVSALASRPVDDGFVRPSGNWRLSLPDDHGAHADARTELWQLALHLRDDKGQPLGLQFSLLRIGLVPPGGTAPTTAWDARDLYRGHIVLMGASDQGYGVAEERFGRGMAGLVGYDQTLRELRIDAWALDFDGQTDPVRWRLTALAGKFRINLVLTPVKQPASSGAAEVPFRGYTVSRLAVEGEVSAPDGQMPVAGTGWFDHLWGELPVPGDAPVVSDRLQLQLDDGSDIALIRTRRVDGSATPTVDATLVNSAGEVTVMGGEATSGLAQSWQDSGDWRLTLGDLDLSLKALVPVREQPFVAPVWSGLVRAEGQRSGQPVTGTGTLQLTGYGLQ
jgi:predicted secreted hydrolase